MVLRKIEAKNNLLCNVREQGNVSNASPTPGSQSSTETSQFAMKVAPGISVGCGKGPRICNKLMRASDFMPVVLKMEPIEAAL